MSGERNATLASSVKLGSAVSALSIAGSLLAIAGAFFSWVKVTFPAIDFQATINGTETWEGRVLVVLGLLSLANAILVRVPAVSRIPVLAAVGWRAAIAHALGAAAILAVCVHAITTLRTRAISTMDVAAAVAYHMSVDQVRPGVQHALDIGFLKSSLDFGIWVAVTGGLFVLAAAIGATRSVKRDPEPNAL